MGLFIEGLDDLLEAFDGLSGTVVDAAEEGLKSGLKHMVETAKLLVPVDKGDLRKSITSTVERKGDVVDGEVLATSDHAIFVEMGTGDRGQASDEGKAQGATYTIGHPGQPAQPFLYPAYQLTEKIVLGDVKTSARRKLLGG